MSDSFEIYNSEIDCATLSDALQHDSAGGFVSFEGWVRDHNEGHAVSALEYEVFHDLALSEGKKVIKEALDKFGIVNARAVHREGRLQIGECAVWIGVVAAHRGEAFTACRYIIDELKHRLPIWKKEHYLHREAEWVNCQHCHNHAKTSRLEADEFYGRQMILPQIGAHGQEKLKNARILVIGAGGLGSAALLGLAGAGIGTIGIADYDTISPSNLHRQILYSAENLGEDKATHAKRRLEGLNPMIDIRTYSEKVTADNIQDLFTDYDIILDCTDNFTAKYLINDAAHFYNKPLIQSSIYQFEGQILTLDPNDKDTGCLRCLFPQIPEPGMVGDCATAGVLGTVPMLFGTLQANQAIKKILGIETGSSFLTFDLITLQSQPLDLPRNPSCPLCGQAPHLASLEPNLEIIIPTKDDQAAKSLKNIYTLIDVREGAELQINTVEDTFHMPLSAFDMNTLKAPKDKELLVICEHGVRSLAAARALRKAGWEKAYSLAGGLHAVPCLRVSKDEDIPA